MSQEASESEVKEACAHLERTYAGLWIDTKSLAALFHVHIVTVKKRLAKVREFGRLSRKSRTKQGRPREWSISVVCQFLHNWRIDADLFQVHAGCPIEWWKRYPAMMRSSSGFRRVSKIEVRLHYVDGASPDAVEISPNDLQGDAFPNLIKAVRLACKK